MSDTAISSVSESASFADLRAMLDPAAEPATETVETPQDTPEAAEAVESTPATEPEPEKNQERDEQGKFAKKDDLPEEIQKTVNKRIAKEIDKRRLLEARLSELEAKLTANPGSQPAKETAQPDTDQEPKLDGFDTYEAYADKHARWAARQEYQRLRAEEAEKTQRTTAEAGAKAQIDAYRQRRAEFEAQHEDYDEVISSIPDPPSHITAALLESENGPAVAYALAKDKAEYERIAKMTPAAALLALGRFEARLDTPVPQPKSSPLPKPPANVGGGGGPAVVDLATCDFRTFKREIGRQLGR